MTLPELTDGKVRAPCPGCGGKISTFVPMVVERIAGVSATLEQLQYPIEVARPHEAGDDPVCDTLLECTMCREAALATTLHRMVGIGGDTAVYEATLLAFYPPVIAPAPVPKNVPKGIVREVREAELCASVRAFRGGVTMLRSALEKLFRANGYAKKKETWDLFRCIDAAAADGVITAADARRAHDQVRQLGNDVVHDTWQAVTEDQWAEAHHYVRRIVDCFYDHRPTTLAVLVEKGRLRTDESTDA